MGTKKEQLDLTATVANAWKNMRSVKEVIDTVKTLGLPITVSKEVLREEVCKTFIQARKEVGVTQRDFAREHHLGQATLSKWLSEYLAKNFDQYQQRLIRETNRQMTFDDAKKVEGTVENNTISGVITTNRLEKKPPAQTHKVVTECMRRVAKTLFSIAKYIDEAYS